MNKKGQGALEYLLLIGGAVLVAVIVVVILLSMTHTTTDATQLATAKALCVQQSVIDGDQLCNGSVVIEGETFDCSGTYPDCAVALA